MTCRLDLFEENFLFLLTKKNCIKKIVIFSKDFLLIKQIRKNFVNFLKF